MVFNLNFHFLRNEFIRLASSTTFDSPVAVFAVPLFERHTCHLSTGLTFGQPFGTAKFCREALCFFQGKPW